jgi:hypothetical protein
MADQAFGRRTDLNNPNAKVRQMVARNQQYGKATEQLASQKIVPMSKPPTDNVAAKQKAAPLMPFDRPTNKPLEPITAGAPFGPGPNPVAAGVPMFNAMQSAVEEVKFLAQLEQNSDLADLASRWMS